MEEIILKELIKSSRMTSDNEFVIWRDKNSLQALAKKINEAINYTRSCEELCDEERCSYTLNNNSKMCDDCGKVFG